ncbi:MAG: phosphoenolpyruvate carboxylase [Planctomycetota bacterium]
MAEFVGAAAKLERLLDEEIASAGRMGALDAERTLRAFCKPVSGAMVGDLDAAASWLAEQPVATILSIIQLLTLRFHLRNKAEQLVIATTNRRREHEATHDAPRSESIAEAVATIARAGGGVDSLRATLRRLDIQPTLTAHPTEARRRAVLRKQVRIAAVLDRLDDARLTPAEKAAADRELRRVLLGLVVTDEVRSERLDAIDEVRNGLHYLAGSIWETIPRLYDDLRAAAVEYFGSDGAMDLGRVGPIVRYRSWIGGDRDGNPRVTPSATEHALRLHRETATDLYLDAIEELRLQLSVSTRRRPAAGALLRAIESDASSEDDSLKHIRYEPYRVRLIQIASTLRSARDGSGRYSAAEFESDLRTIRESLVETGIGSLAQGPLDDLLLRVKTFGLHMASLDVRQHSAWHEAAVDELLRMGGVCDSYADLDEAERLGVLRSELASGRPLLPKGARLSERSRNVLDTLGVLSRAVVEEPDSIGAYIVSMTHEVSDLLEPLLLMREVGLYRAAGPAGPAIGLLDVVPLFETVDDLERAESLLDVLLAEPLYRDHLRERGDLQEIMLGYSDSNKDGGYWVANWRLHCAQRRVTQACERANIGVRLFHGRGGTVGRGGGRANRAIQAAPRESQNGRIRFTEQGEVISFRYSLPAIAHRHLEQIVNAMLVTTHSGLVRDDQNDDEPDGSSAIMDQLAATSRETYRSLIDDDRFWPWYMQTTPVTHISDLPLASRPVLRSAGGLDFDRLRAIPWVFSWMQIRATVPGWYGLGTALSAAIEKNPSLRGRFQEWNGQWPFFAAVVGNAEQDLARCRLPITARYGAAAGFGEDDPIMRLLHDEYERSHRLICEITGSDRLLDRRPVIAGLIDARNPDTDALNLCQIELMRRARSGSDDDLLAPALLASLNGIAAAMQSTG